MKTKKMEFISLKIEDGEEDTEKKIKVFNLSNDDNREEYERIMNDPDKTILEESPPSIDKLGRVLLTVK